MTQMTQWQGNQLAHASLADVLDKVLDKGMVVAGDIQVSLANVELLTIKVRLLVCSVDKATEIGLDWWRHDRFLSSSGDSEAAQLRERVAALEQMLASESRQALPSKQQPRGQRPNTRRRRGGGSENP